MNKLLEEFPQAGISNGLIDATLYLPDARRGYYRGTRFDWSGIIRSLCYQGHNYFGRWFEQHDSVVHDAITGPVEEFQSNGSGLGYEEAARILKCNPITIGTRLRRARNMLYDILAKYGYTL